MALKVDLNKSAQALKLSLQKAGVRPDIKMDIAFDLDVSGSFEDEHRDGLTNDLLVRLVPWGMVFDPDQQIDVFTFSNGVGHAYHVGIVTPDTVENYVNNRIIDRVPGWNGGTDYSYVLEMNLRHFGWLEKTSENDRNKKQKNGGLLGKLFSRKSEPTSKIPAATTIEKKKSLIIFVTDGDNSDHIRTMQVLSNSEQKKDLVYFLFIGISNQGGNFPFLQEIADRFSNTGLVIIRDLKKWSNRTDEELNQEFLNEELLEWLKK